MIPVANFLVSPNFLTVKFTDISTGTPTSWSWDFGDLTSAVVTQNPSHTYTTPGKYVVKLTSTNTDGSGSLQREIVVSTVPVLPVTLKTFLSLKLPSAITFSEELKDAYISQWQLYMQNLVLPEVSDNNVFNEIAYPPLANVLIANLAAYSILSEESIKAAVSLASSGVNGVSGAVKQIKTGPSEAEFQENSQLHKTIYGPNGALSQLRSEICGLGQKLDIWFPMCPPLPKVVLNNLKAGRTTHIKIPVTYSPMWELYPLSIPITC